VYATSRRTNSGSDYVRSGPGLRSATSSDVEGGDLSHTLAEA
jgi:hypothetical protein